MSDKATVPFDPVTTQAKAFMSAVRSAANQLQSDELERDKKVKRYEEELNSRASKISNAEKELKQQCVELEQEKKKLDAAQRKLVLDCGNFNYQMLQREKHLKQRRDNIEAAKNQLSSLLESDQVVEIQVGDQVFKTFCNTLRRFPESTLAQSMDAMPLCTEGRSDHPYTMFIDRDGRHFNFILNYLRRGGDEEQFLDYILVHNYDLDTIEDIMEEAKYYNLKQLVKILNWVQLRHHAVHEVAYLISEGLFVSSDSSCTTTKEIPPGEVLDLRMRNFTGIRFERVHFKCNTSFQGSVLERAVFSKCKFEAMVDFIDTDLRKAQFVCCELGPLPILVAGANTKDAELPSCVRDY